MEFSILGPVDVTVGGRSLELSGARARAVLATLIVHANHVVAAGTAARRAVAAAAR